MKQEKENSEPEKILVNLYGGLESYSPDGSRRDNILSADSVECTGDIIDFFQIPSDEIQVILINGRHADRDTSVKAGDEVSLFPLVGGG